MARILTPPPIAKSRNYNDLCRDVTEKILKLSQQYIKQCGYFVMALAGGSTPQGVYALMASSGYQNQFEWEKMHFFLGDERWVPNDTLRSNYKMISDTGFPMKNVHALKTENISAQATAKDYENQLAHFFNLKSGEIPRFHLILLGMGDDGHTASLFPNDKSLQEKKRFSIAVTQNATKEKRITLTIPVFNQAENIMFIVSGQNKAKILKDVLQNKQHLPASLIRPHRGQLCWFIDQAAGANLNA